MKKILGLTAMVLLLAGPAFADSSVINYTLEVGGNNHADQYEAGGTPLFTGGQTSLLNLAQGVDVVTWDVRVAVSGLVNVGGVDYPCSGAANLVWTLELYKPDGTLAAIGAAPLSCTTGTLGTDCTNAQPTDAGFLSTINDGDKDGARGADPLLGGCDKQLLAAFAYGWQTGTGSGIARIFDLSTANGPELKRTQYPSAYLFPTGSTAPQGKLVGMGAGYEQFQATGMGGTQTAGVGIADTSATCYLGTGPVAEGQICLKNLPGGTYTLKLVPGQGNNVLSVETCNVGTSGRFAAAATTVNPIVPDTTNGGAVQFVYNPVVVQPAPVLQAAVSRKLHTTVNVNYDIPLPLTGNAGIECRQNGPTQIILSYDVNVAGTPVIGLSAGTLGTVAVGSPTAKDVTINLSGVPNGFAAPYAGTCLTVTIDGVANAAGGAIAATQTLKVGAIYGDVNGNRTVNATDIGFVKFNSGKPVDATTFKYDLNCNGSINATDIGFVKFMSGKGTLASCP